MLFLEPVIKIFLGLHGLVSVIALVALLLSFAYLVLREEPEWRTGRILGAIGGVSYLLSFVLGLLIYPVFKIRVRAYDFDISKQWATALFEIKEHISAVALFAVIGFLVINLFKKLEESSPSIKKLYSSLISIAFFVTFVVSVLGLALVFVRSI